MVSRAYLTKTTGMAATAIALGIFISACDGARGGEVTGIVSFGDSLSDVGNFYAATGGLAPPSSLNYDNGRFSNGLNWVSIWLKTSESQPRPPAPVGEPIMPTAAR